MLKFKSLRKILKIGSLPLLLIWPLLAKAQASSEPSNFQELVGVFLTIINRLIPIIFTLTFTAVVFFVIKDWILIGSEASIESGKKRLLIGIIALVVMSGVWGIVALLKASLLGGAD